MSMVLHARMLPQRGRVRCACGSVPRMDQVTRYEFDIDGASTCSASWWEETFELSIGMRWDDEFDVDDAVAAADQAASDELGPDGDDRNEQGVWLGVGGMAACMMSGPIEDDGDLDTVAVAALPDAVEMGRRAARIHVLWPQLVRTSRYMTAGGMRLRVTFSHSSAVAAWQLPDTAVVAVAAGGELAALDLPIVDQDAGDTDAAPAWVQELQELGARPAGDGDEDGEEGSNLAMPGADMEHMERATLIMLRGLTEHLEALVERGVSAPVLLDMAEELADEQGWTRMVNPMSGQGAGAPDLAVTWAGASSSVTVAIHGERPTVPFAAEGIVPVLLDDEVVPFEHQALELPDEASGEPSPPMHQLLGQVGGAWVTIDSFGLHPGETQLSLVRLHDPASFAADLRAQVALMREQVLGLEAQVHAPLGSATSEAREAIQDWVRGVMSKDAVLVVSRTHPEVVTARGGAQAYVEQLAERFGGLELAGSGGSPLVEVDEEAGTARVQYRARFRPAGSAPEEQVVVSVGEEPEDEYAWLTAQLADDGLWYVTVDLVDLLDSDLAGG